MFVLYMGHDAWMLQDSRRKLMIALLEERQAAAAAAAASVHYGMEN